MKLADQIKAAVSEAIADIRAALKPESTKPAAAAVAEPTSDNPILTEQVRAEIDGAVKAAVEPIQKELAQSKIDLDAANTNIADLQAEVRTKDAKISALEATIADPKGKIEQIASTKAVEIASSQGVPALAARPPANPAATTATATNLKGRARLEAAINAEFAKTLPAARTGN